MRPAEVRLFQRELHPVCGKAELATAAGLRMPKVPEITPLKGEGRLDESISVVAAVDPAQSLQLISVIDAVGRGHLGRQTSCEMSWGKRKGAWAAICHTLGVPRFGALEPASFRGFKPWNANLRPKTEPWK